MDDSLYFWQGILVDRMKYLKELMESLKTALHCKIFIFLTILGQHLWHLSHKSRKKWENGRCSVLHCPAHSSIGCPPQCDRLPRHAPEIHLVPSEEPSPIRPVIGTRPFLAERERDVKALTGVLSCSGDRSAWRVWRLQFSSCFITTEYLQWRDSGSGARFMALYQLQLKKSERRDAVKWKGLMEKLQGWRVHLEVGTLGYKHVWKAYLRGLLSWMFDP